MLSRNAGTNAAYQLKETVLQSDTWCIFVVTICVRLWTVWAALI